MSGVWSWFLPENVFEKRKGERAAIGECFCVLSSRQPVKAANRRGRRRTAPREARRAYAILQALLNCVAARFVERAAEWADFAGIRRPPSVPATAFHSTAFLYAARSTACDGNASHAGGA